MSKRTGYFSTLGSGCSPATIVMHFAGQTVSQSMHPTQRGVPSSRTVRRCRPRNRVASGLGSSGYWKVTVARVQKKVPEEMREGDFETADDLRNIELFPESQLAPAKHFDGHQDLPLE